MVSKYNFAIILKPYVMAKLKNRMDITNKELYSLCDASNDNMKASVRALKSQYIEEFKNESNGENHETKTSNLYTSEDVKSKFHEDLKIESRTPEISKHHILDLIKKYPELPLYIYSKIFERVKPEYDKLNEMCDKEFKKTGKVKTRKLLTFSFYDYYIEIFNEINEGIHDQEIIEYMKEVINNFGQTHTYELEGSDFNKDFDDYEYFLEWVLDIIADTVDYFTQEFGFNELRIEMLRYLLTKSNGDQTRFVTNIIEERSKELIRSDILKLYILGRKTYPNMESIEELYDEFDLRYSDKLDYAERGINYKGQYNHLFYTDKNKEKHNISSLEMSLIWEKEGFEGLVRCGIFARIPDEKNKKGWIELFKRYLKDKPENYLEFVSLSEEDPEVEIITPKQQIIDKVDQFELELNRIKNGSVGKNS